MSQLRQPSVGSGTKRRALTFAAVAFLHLCFIFGPFLILGALDVRKPKEQMFRVKIGPSELSKGPAVGMPERRPPRKAVSEPEIPVVKPKVPAVKPRPEPKIPKVKPKPKPEPKIPKVKPRPEPKIPKVKPKPRPEPKIPAVKPKPEPKVPKVKPKPSRRKPKRDPMDDVYTDPSPPNLNPHVPVGTKDRAQKHAPKPDHKAPGGGARADEETFARYGKNVERFIYAKWNEPPRSLLGGAFPETVIEVTIEEDGRVSKAVIVRPSSSRAMEESVKQLLSRLDLLPRPPEGRISFRITLKTR